MTAENNSIPPVLLLIFRRPDLTRRMLEPVRRARPARLYVAADGPREEHPEDQQLCEEARRIAIAVDWPCEVHTLFRERNLGCRVGVSTALDWFFEHEEAGIILEDDCLASASFFRYCAELLARFRDDERIMCVSGDNFQRGRTISPYSYYFSRYMHCWGWASWRRAWRLYDRDMTLWPEFKASNGLGAWSDGDPAFVRYWTHIFDAAAAGQIDSWAFRFLFSCWANSGLTCLPERNLVSNIGQGEDATHTGGSDEWVHQVHAANELAFPLRHPISMLRDSDADRFEQDNIYCPPEPPESVLSLRRAARTVIPAPVRNSIRRLRASLLQ